MSGGDSSNAPGSNSLSQMMSPSMSNTNKNLMGNTMVNSPGMLSPSTPMSPMVMSPQSAVSMMSPPISGQSGDQMNQQQQSRVPLKPNQIVVTAEINSQQPPQPQQTMLSPVKQEVNSKQQTNCANQAYMQATNTQQQQNQFKWNNQTGNSNSYGIAQQQSFYNNNNPYQSNAYCQSSNNAWAGQYQNGKFQVILNYF